MKTKKETYENILPQIEKIVSASSESTAKLEKICRLLRDSVTYFDWVGFYIWNGGKKILELDKFVGANTEHKTIPAGNGICGQVAETRRTTTVQNVSRVENYLACSLEVQAEIVVPVFQNGKFVAELDIDSHTAAPFSNEDEYFLEKICTRIGELFSNES